ncbi:olfactory receptor 11H6-like [Varanus komodoensis]|uniref:olfactory receptor 11H6-like n=1 Tax=Varanus komodoensis TaxID=61221 RepID=UPI001CF779AC|nr:olfactory receptor 11H6-like [Varanus komodoensis]
METANGTCVKEFILLGFLVEPQKRFMLLVFFAILYVLTLTENITVIALVSLDAHLAQLPMYILLSNFSWLEICYVTSTVPRMLFDLASAHGIISFQACFLQFYMLFSLGFTEFFFLSAMAFDRYLAICHPLHYAQIMSPKSCYSLVAACWVFGFLVFIIPVIWISKLSFCGPNIIDHFLCDPGPILSLACPPLGKVPLLCQIVEYTLFLGNFLFLQLSYSNVIFTLLKSSGTRRKAFSTISMHLTVAIIFYGSVGGMYLIPGGESHSEITKMVTVFYAAGTPFLNPLIYCLRNNQVKEALRRLLRRRLSFLMGKVTVSKV